MKRGFTLLQMVLVLLIVSALLVVTTIEGSHLNSQLTLNTAVNTVMQEYENVRKQAMVSGTSYLVYFYKDHAVYYRRSLEDKNIIFNYQFPAGVTAFPHQRLHVRGETGYVEPMIVTFTGANHQQRRVSFQLGGEYLVQEQ
ncbi:MAG: hypothetical protein Q4A55_04100 [Aerococcus sp.]|nr:hypothetical protein [Aerococcus sp.]